MLPFPEEIPGEINPSSKRQVAVMDARRQEQRQCQRLRRLGERAEGGKQEQIQPDTCHRVMAQDQREVKRGSQRHPLNCIMKQLKSSYSGRGQTGITHFTTLEERFCSIKTTMRINFLNFFHQRKYLTPVLVDKFFNIV